MNLVKMTQVYFHIYGVAAMKAVRNNEGRACYLHPETMCQNRFQMTDGIMPAAGVKGIGVCQVGTASGLLHTIDKLPDKQGRNVGIVAFLSYMQLDRGRFVCANEVGKAGYVKKPSDFGALISARPLAAQVGNVNLAFVGHVNASLSVLAIMY
jgi:hypothetical protein